MSMTEELKKLFEEIQSKRGERKGFILKPTHNGFEIYTLPEDRISKILDNERVFKHYSDPPQESEKGDEK